MKKVIVGLSFALMSVLAFALPTLQQVETEVQKGNLAQAQTLMQEVIAARPDSAKAHYIYAEILARNRDFAKAAEEARQARRLDPQITFTQPEKFRNFEQLLAREQNPQPAQTRSGLNGAVPSSMAPAGARADAPAPAERSAGTGIPGWVWGAGLAVLAVVAWRGFQRSRAAAAPYAGGAAAAAPFGANAAGVDPRFGGGDPRFGGGVMPGGTGAYGPMSAPGRSGMLGTGLAAAGGVAAGMLASELMHRNGSNADASNNVAGADPNNGLEPFDPAGGAASELEARPVDFGTGNDWDSGGGSIDVGSGGDDGDWG